jgi:hypothetical protein
VQEHQRPVTSKWRKVVARLRGGLGSR